MNYTPLSRMQRTIAALYCEGDMTHIETMEELEECGDTLFEFVMREVLTASTKEDVEELIQSAIGQLQGILDGLDDVPQIPLADRYAERVVKDSSEVSGLEIRGVRYTNDRLDVFVDNERPDFFSVYAMIQGGPGVAVGDFIAHEAAVEYAKHLDGEWMLSDPVVDQTDGKPMNP